MITRRIFTTAMASLLMSASAMAKARQAPIAARVYRSPACGCCGAWVAHLKENGFEVEVVMTDDMEIVKNRHEVPTSLRSCHTALIDGYVIEGHVPAGDIRKLLDRRPQAGGLAVPGMPIGSPGMEMDGQGDPYDVILWARSGTRVFSSHRG